MLRRNLLPMFGPIAVFLFLPRVLAQLDTTSDTDTSTSTSDTASSTTSTDLSTTTPSLQDSTCTFLTGNSCKQGSCNYCARCVQQSCILANYTGVPTDTRGSCSGKSKQSWYDYCVSTGYDANGVSCTDNVQCYPYRNSTPESWPNLACDPNLCFVISANGSPAPTPSYIGNYSTTVSSGPQATSSSPPSDVNDNASAVGSTRPSVTTIALIAVSSLLFVLGLAWLTRILTKCRVCPTPFFQRRDEQTPTSTDIAPHQVDNQSSSSSIMTEPLPVYVPPDAPPPKYENAIVNQIREDRNTAATSPWINEMIMENPELNEVSGNLGMQEVPASPTRSILPFFHRR